MFSDLPHCPRQQLVLRNAADPLLPYVNKASTNLTTGQDFFPASKDVDVCGVDRHRFFFRCVIELNS